jgi:hypothetical protein
MGMRELHHSDPVEYPDLAQLVFKLATDTGERFGRSSGSWLVAVRI